MGRKRYVILINKQGVLGFLFMLLIILWTGANTYNPDLHNYIYGYNRITEARELNYIYIFVKNFCFTHGVTFHIFRLLIYAASYIVFGISFKRMIGCSSPIIYIFYAISFMMIDSTQTNNFLGLSLLFLGISYLLVEESRIKYTICIIIASGFHVVFLFYLPFVFIYRRTDRKQLLKLYLIVLGIVILLSTIMSMSGLASVMNRIISLMGLDNYSGFIEARTRFGHLYPMLSHLVCCVYGLYFYKKSVELRLENEKKSRVILLLLLYGVFAFPLFRFQLTLGRLSRNLQLLTFISGISYAKELSSPAKKRNVYIALFTLSLFLAYMILYRNYMDNIVRPFFEYNWIFTGK